MHCGEEIRGMWPQFPGPEIQEPILHVYHPLLTVKYLPGHIRGPLYVADDFIDLILGQNLLDPHPSLALLLDKLFAAVSPPVLYVYQYVFGLP